MKRLRSGRIGIALHTLSEAPGPALLGIHALAGSHRDFADLAASWPGPVHALDLAGHGASERLRGRAYSCESWAGDADAALRELGNAWLVGAGAGAFVALLLAGARPGAAAGALLLPGRGLAGNGEYPDELRVDADRAFLKECLRAETAADDGFDPLVIETEGHHRPRRYARGFAESAGPLLLAEDGGDRPSWWDALRDLPRATRVPSDPVAALTALAGLASEAN